jgi:hypothetical protein
MAAVLHFLFMRKGECPVLGIVSPGLPWNSGKSNFWQNINLESLRMACTSRNLFTYTRDVSAMEDEDIIPFGERNDWLRRFWFDNHRFFNANFTNAYGSGLFLSPILLPLFAFASTRLGPGSRTRTMITAEERTTSTNSSTPELSEPAPMNSICQITHVYLDYYGRCWICGTGGLWVFSTEAHTISCKLGIAYWNESQDCRETDLH